MDSELRDLADHVAKNGLLAPSEDGEVLEISPQAKRLMTLLREREHQMADESSPQAARSRSMP